MGYTQFGSFTNNSAPAINAAFLNAVEAGILGAQRSYLKVASSDCPQQVKDGCEFVCTGTNDQIVINSALLKASRPSDGFGGIGLVGVMLVGPNFFVGHNGGAITMYPNTSLFGQWQGTVVNPNYPTNLDQGVIELLNDTVHGVSVGNMTIGKPNAVNHNGHGIHFLQSGEGSAYDNKHGSDTYQKIIGINFNRPARKCLWLEGAAGGNRESQVFDNIFWSAGVNGCHIESSDCEITRCRANGQTSTGSAFVIAGGNSKIADCKAYFSGVNGFDISSSRINVSDCDAQDNAGWGFNITGDNATVVGCVADSNQRTDGNPNTRGGFNIGANGFYEVHAFNRPQNSVTQNRPIVFSGSPSVYISGRAEINSIVTPPAGTHVTGTPGANSYARIQRDGTTVFSVG